MATRTAPTTRDRKGGILSRLVSAARVVAFGYDATEDTGRRRSTPSALTAEDRVLPSAKRKKLIATARDVIRNYCTAAWMVRCHLDYVSRFSFQARTGNDALDDRIEELIGWASERRNFDVSQRFSRSKAMRISEARRVLDGDIGWAKLSSGGIQLIESDRIRTPERAALLGDYKPEDFTHGVLCNKWGRIEAVCICRRGQTGSGYEFERIIPARNFWLHVYWDSTYRVDQVRGISPLAPALNTLKDVYEGLDYAMAKAKVAQMFGLAIFRQNVQRQGEGWGTAQVGVDNPPEDEEAQSAGAGEQAGDTERYEVDPGAGPFKLELEDTDRAEFLSTNTPETQLLAAMAFATDLSLKALDIPYSFYDSSKVNYYGQKADIQKYENSAHSKREDNQGLLDDWARWRLQLLVLEGTLVLPGEITVDDLDWEWIPAAMPWVDKLRELKGDVLALDNNLDSEIRIARSRGQDAYEIAGERMDFEEWVRGERDRRKLPPMPAPGARAPVAESDTTKEDDNA
ncbi:MAG: phage portal protein [Phycisphaerae bacterium]|nr:phage portal protein [Phycisphaerae bacterium]